MFARRMVFCCVFFIVMGAKSFAGQHEITIGFDVTEGALNAAIHTQIFPSSQFTEYNEDYYFYLESPQITLVTGTNTIEWSGQIAGGYTINGTPYTFSHLISVPISFHDDITITGIIGFLQDIPNEINSWDIPDALKSHIINAYTGLDLELYPNAVMHIANDAIPDDYAIDVQNITLLSWTVDPGVVHFSSGITINSAPPLFQIKWWGAGLGYHFKVKGNVDAQIDKCTVKWNSYGSLYDIIGQNENLNLSTQKDTWSEFDIDCDGDWIPNSYHRVYLFFTIANNYYMKVWNYPGPPPTTEIYAELMVPRNPQ